MNGVVGSNPSGGKRGKVRRQVGKVEKIVRKAEIFEIIEKPVATKSVLDGRTGFFKNRKIIEELLNLGYSRDDLIPYDDLEHVIGIIRGSDPRTIRKTLKELVMFDYLEPATKEMVYERKRVAIRTQNTIRWREYSTPKGYKYYRLGPRAPVSFQVKLVPPVPPNNACEGVGEKYVCVRDVGEKVKESGFYRSYNIDGYDDSKITINNNAVLHTHISCKNKAKMHNENSQFLQENDDGLAFLEKVYRASREANPE